MYRTGTEQQRTERCDLIQQIIELKEEAAAALITEFGADDHSPYISENETSSQPESQIAQPLEPLNLETESPRSSSSDLPLPKPDSKATIRAERRAADDDRNAAFEKYKRGEHTH